MSQRALAIALIVSMGSLGACGGDAPPPAAAGTATGPATPLSGSAPAATSVAAVAVGTATVPIRLGFLIVERPEPGRKSAVTLTLIAAEDLDRVEVSVSSQSLMVAPEDASFSLSPLRAGETVEHAVGITPQAEGLADLTLLVKALSAEEQSEASFVVPVLAEAAAR